MEKFYSVGVNDLCSVSRMDVVKRGFLFLQGWGGGGGFRRIFEAVRRKGA